MEENQKKAFDFASETTKQLITISTAIITLTVTFSKEIIGNPDTAPKTLLVATWAVFILSIILGLATLMSLTGTLQPMVRKSIPPVSNQNAPSSPSSSSQGSVQTINAVDKININNSNIRFFSIFQALSFICAIIMTGVFGFQSLNNNNANHPKNDSYMVIRHSILNNDSSKIFTDTLYLKR